MKALVCFVALMVVGCGSKTDEAIAEKVSDSPEEAAEFKPDPNATLPTSNVPYTDTRSTQTSAVAVAPKTPELDRLLSQEALIEWDEDSKQAYGQGCMREARKTLDETQSGRYCMCALVVTEAMTGSVDEYLSRPTTYNSAFVNIGAGTYCVAVAKGAKP